MRDYSRRASVINRMVTSWTNYGPGGIKKVKNDIGFTETIRWYSLNWTSPGWPGEETKKTEYSVIMPDGHRTTLKYGVVKDLITKMLDDHWSCEGFWFENESEAVCISVDEVLKKIGWDTCVWYDINDWYDYDIWKYEFVIYYGSNAPIYFAASEIECLPDLENAGEVYLEDDLVQDGPCPYDYPEKEEE